MEIRSKDTFTLEDVFVKSRIFSLLTGLGMLCVAYVLEYYANLYELEYSQRSTSTYVGDIILDNIPSIIPSINLNLIIIEGALLAIGLGTLFVIFFRPRHIIFTLKVIALFITIRAFFISLTHVGIYPGMIEPGPGFFASIYSYLNLQTGFFFSGHTGMTFLMALIFWKEYYTRVIFLSVSFIFAVGVLLARVHYSIDVFAAPFMAYGIFEIAKYFFPRDYKLIEEAPPRAGTHTAV